MLYQNKHTPQFVVPRAPFDECGEGSFAPNRTATGTASEASLGNLRDRYADDHSGEAANPYKPRGKEASGDDAKTVRLAERFALQRTSGELLPSMRVAHCLWTAVGDYVDVLKRKKDVRFGGVQTCGSWSACPICAARIAEVRRQELRQLEEWVGSPRRGLRMIMMTLTARHRRRALKSLVERMAKAKARMQNRNPWKPLRKSGVLAGSVSVREATYGQKNGWHPHYHVLLLVRADSDEEAMAMLEPLRRVWLDCLRKEGLSGTSERAFDLQNGAAVAAYLSKHGRNKEDRKAAQEARSGWGMAEEMTQSRAKRGRGEGPEQSRAPFQLLRDAQEGCEASAKLWQEYAIVMWGKRQQVWSNGLKEAVGLLEAEDEEIAEGEEYTEEEDELLHRFDRSDWRRWRPFRAEILAAARAGGAEAIKAFIEQQISGPEGEPEVIEEDRDELSPAARQRENAVEIDRALGELDDLIKQEDRDTKQAVGSKSEGRAGGAGETLSPIGQNQLCGFSQGGDNVLWMGGDNDAVRFIHHQTERVRER